MRKVILLLKKRIRLILCFVLILLFIFLTFLFVNFKYSGKLLPNVYIAGVDIGGLNLEQAAQSLSQIIKAPQKIKLVSSVDTFDLSTHDVNLIYDFSKSVNRAYNYTRSGNYFLDSVNIVKSFFIPKSFGLTTNIDESKLNKFISVIDGQISTDPIQPSVSLINEKIQLNKGREGVEINRTQLRANIGATLAYAKNDEVTIPIKKVGGALTDKESSKLQTRANNLVGKNIKIKFESQPSVIDTFTYPDVSLLKLLNPKGGVDDGEIAKIISEVAKKINRDPQNPKFNFDGTKVAEFEPALDGIKLDENKLKENLTDAMSQVENSEDKQITIDAPVTKTAPDVTTDKVNNLGIKELIGRGTSTYFHSIPGRVFNVSLATSKVNGSLVKPGETFSFNNTLGDVSGFTGYQQAYIISDGKTILGDGGGVCQVSSTLFRALLNAGLPITERTAHAYRVGYYEQNSPPGMDSTVYGPLPDLKFTNDTGSYVLIVAKADPKHYSLVFELYGTRDGRVATITKPVISDVVPALATVYQDDPTLPVGTTKQVDFSAAGAKVSFNYNVTRNGQSIFSKKFTSNYRPWAAVYLRGTAQ